MRVVLLSVLSGTITDDMGLYRGYIRITNDVTGEIVKEQLYEIHGIRSYNFNVPAISTVTAVTDYTVSVFYEDHGLNGVNQYVEGKNESLIRAIQSAEAPAPSFLHYKRPSNPLVSR